MFTSKIFHGEDAVEQVWRDEENLPYQCIGDNYLTQKRAEMTGLRYIIVELFAGSMCFAKKLLESPGLSVSNEKISLHSFIPCVHSTLIGNGL